MYLFFYYFQRTLINRGSEVVRSTPKHQPSTSLFVNQLTEEEVLNMVSQNTIPSKQHYGGFLTYTFTDEVVMSKIYLLRGQKVMLGSDLAALYGIETKNLNKAVKINISRFPDDFMFRCSKEEYDVLRFHFGTSKHGLGGVVT